MFGISIQDELIVHTKYFNNNCSDLIADEFRFNYCDYNNREKCCQDTLNFYYNKYIPNICYEINNNSSMFFECNFTTFYLEFFIKICLIITIVISCILLYYNCKNKNEDVIILENINKYDNQKILQKV